MRTLTKCLEITSKKLIVMNELNPRLIGLFNNFMVSKGPKDFHGIPYTSELTESGDILFSFTNDNDLSYNPYCLEDVAFDKVNDFVNMIGESGSWGPNSMFSRLSRKIEMSVDGNIILNSSETNMRNRKNYQFYLNKNDLNTFRRIARKTTLFDVSDFRSMCETTFMDIYLESDDHVMVELQVDFYLPQYEGKDIDEMGQVSEILGKILEDDDEAFDYTRSNFADGIVEVIWNNPLMISKEYMMVSNSLEYYFRGKKVKLY